jgi:4'-phosphopantetheinyl transferase EntD
MTDAIISLQDLFPEQVICIVSSGPPENFELLAGEREATREMTPLRLREFEHGRSCARRALAELGYPDCAVPTTQNRSPEWPTGVVGSITHCGGKAAAAVARAADIGGIGLDIETDEPLDENLLPIICRDDEWPQASSVEERLLLGKLIFSAKESVFKCIWPQVRRFIDFTEVSIELGLERNTFTATPHTLDLPQQLFDRLTGRFDRRDHMIVTALTAAKPIR